MKTERYNNRPIFNLKNLCFIITFLSFTVIYSQSFAQAPWVTPKAAKSVKNPFAGNKTVLAAGKTLYVANCVPCHGSKGKGDGAASAALNPKPADHSSARVQSETDGSLYWKLSAGRNPMPSYQKILSDKQRWELVDYIRTLAKK
jgi:mono/diheme cytochrome c family protein